MKRKNDTSAQTKVADWLASTATQARDTGYIIVTDDLRCALDTAAYLLDLQGASGEEYAAWQADQHYTYGG